MTRFVSACFYNYQFRTSKLIAVKCPYSVSIRYLNRCYALIYGYQAAASSPLNLDYHSMQYATIVPYDQIIGRSWQYIEAHFRAILFLLKIVMLGSGSLLGQTLKSLPQNPVKSAPLYTYFERAQFNIMINKINRSIIYEDHM